jgi:hypothetical protein
MTWGMYMITIHAKKSTDLNTAALALAIELARTANGCVAYSLAGMRWLVAFQGALIGSGNTLPQALRGALDFANEVIEDNR